MPFEKDVALSENQVRDGMATRALMRTLRTQWEAKKPCHEILHTFAYDGVSGSPGTW